MGDSQSKAKQSIKGKTEHRILMVGLDAAGKTTILHQLKLGEVVTTVPTIGFNVETVEYKNINFTVLDAGGQDKIRPFWRHYYHEHNMQGIIFVVDSNDSERINNDYDCKDNAHFELNSMLQEDELKDAALLVLANKQDLPNAMSVNVCTKKLGLNQLKNREWYIQSTCATTGDGLYEGLDWLANTLNKKRYGRSWLNNKVMRPKSPNHKKIGRPVLLNSTYVPSTGIASIGRPVLLNKKIGRPVLPPLNNTKQVKPTEIGK